MTQEDATAANAFVGLASDSATPNTRFAVLMMGVEAVTWTDRTVLSGPESEL